MPPALIVHGARDEVVPAREGYYLRDVLRRHRRVGEVKVYEGVGHCFAPRGPLDWRALAAARDAERLALAFLDRHLGEARRKPAAPPEGSADRPKATRPGTPPREPPAAGLACTRPLLPTEAGRATTPAPSSRERGAWNARAALLFFLAAMACLGLALRRTGVPRLPGGPRARRP
jgi:hypothetical protein